MGKPDQVSSAFWFILALAVIYLSYRLDIGTLTHPGAGFLTFWCGIILSGLSLLIFIQGRLSRRNSQGKAIRELWAGMRWYKGAYVVLAILFYAITFTHLGFLLSTTIWLIFLFKAIEPEMWVRAIVGAVLTSVVSYILFAVWLQVQLPRGFLEGLLF